MTDWGPSIPSTRAHSFFVINVRTFFCHQYIQYIGNSRKSSWRLLSSTSLFVDTVSHHSLGNQNKKAMGRTHEDADRHRSGDKGVRKSSSSKRKKSSRDEREETSEERRLRKAKEYVEQEKRKRSSRHDSDNDDDDDDRDHRGSSRKKSSKSSNRRRRSSRSESPGEAEEQRSSSRKSTSRHREGDRHKSSRKRHKRSDSQAEAEEDHEKRRRNDRDNRKGESSSKQHRGGDDDNKKNKDHSGSGRKDRKHRKQDKYRDSKKVDKKKDKNKDNPEDHSQRKVPKIQKPDKSTLTPLGSPPGIPPAQPLDAEKDYFAFHQQLWVWLYREEGVAFNDLTSEESREAFARFVEQYNDGQLAAAYYDDKGLPSEAIDECKTTRHKWSFQTSETERRGLQMLQDGVRKLTEYSAEDEKQQGKSSRSASTVAAGPSVPERNQHQDAEEAVNRRRRQWTDEERAVHRRANKRLVEDVRITEEEFTGGKADYGRERQLEKKREVATKIHGAARDREDPGVTISDDALYGDGGHGASFQSALAREKKRKAQRMETKQARIQELQQKEQNKQQEMLKKLGLSGLQPGQKIKIAPREEQK